MRVVETLPPNYAEIRRYLNPPSDAIFAFGSLLYNPTGKEIPQDVEIHEEVHGRQMQGYVPEAWWTRYLIDREFRQAMELEAYFVQYSWVKSRVPSKVAKLCLSDLAHNFSSLYNLGITQSQAETLIRKYAIS